MEKELWKYKLYKRDYEGNMGIWGKIHIFFDNSQNRFKLYFYYGNMNKRFYEENMGKSKINVESFVNMYIKIIII